MWLIFWWIKLLKKWEPFKMVSDLSNNCGSIREEFSQVLKDFSQYLSHQKKIGNTCLDVSGKSKTLMNKWGIQSRIKSSFFFQGPDNAMVFIVDSEGSFFNGKSGELLGKILVAMKLGLDSVFICNLGDAESMDLKIRAISPKVIITLGEKAGQSLLNIGVSIEDFRGKFNEYNGIKVMPTYHPSLLLEQPGCKRQVWEDMKLVMEYAGLSNDP